MKLLYGKGKKALFKVPYQINLCIRVPCMENGKIEHQLPANTPPLCKVIFLSVSNYMPICIIK